MHILLHSKVIDEREREREVGGRSKCREVGRSLEVEVGDCLEVR